MNAQNAIEKRRKAAAVAGATAAAVGGIAMSVFAMDYIPREPYINEDDERNTYLTSIIGSESECRHLLRMNIESFVKLVAMCRDKGLLKDTRNVKVEEQMAEFLHTIGHNVKNRVLNHNFKRSGETVSRYFHIVLKAVLSLQDDLLKQPTCDSETPTIIKNSRRFWPWFEVCNAPNIILLWFIYFECLHNKHFYILKHNCIGAIDGTHIRASVPERICNRFRGRKAFPTQNVLAAVSFDLQFTCVLGGWEGSAHDARVLEDSLKRDNGLKIPEGKYYLVDAGYTNQKGFLAPFRATRYHFNEWEDRRPQNPKELFNNRHSSLRNTVERAFGVLKKQWKILDDSEPFFSYETQVDLVLACCILHNHIRRVDPNDIFLAEVEKEMAVQATQIAQEHMQARIDRDVQEKQNRKEGHTQREKHQENREWKAFRISMADDMWINYQAH